MKKKNLKKKTEIGLTPKTNNTFKFKQFEVLQSQTVFRISTEACLFGSFIPLELGFENALEIGVGTGVISLMIAQRNPKLSIDAIDMNEEAHLLSEHNFQQSPWAKQLRSYHSDFRQFQTEKKYDLIFSNPPFYENSLKSDNELKNQAKHLVDFSHVEILAFADKHLSETGSLWMILPEKESENLLKSTSKPLFLNKKVKVRKRKGEATFRYFLQFSKIDQNYSEEELVINENGLEYTEKVYELFKPFYLKL